MSTRKPELWEIARAHVKLDAQGYILNSPEVYALLIAKDGVTDFRARAAIAKAARRMRYDLVPEDQWISPASAARQYGGSVANIRRAAMLGHIAGARQDDGGRWLFSVTAFKAWQADPAMHKPGRRSQATAGKREQFN